MSCLSEAKIAYDYAVWYLQEVEKHKEQHPSEYEKAERILMVAEERLHKEVMHFLLDMVK